MLSIIISKVVVMYDKVIFFANDFGFGPTSNALSIARALMQHDIPVVLVTAKKNDSILQSSGVPIEHIDDLRSVDSITEYLKTFSDSSSLVVSVMNRFVITSANSIGQTCVFVDDLFWFWRDGVRPAEYDAADIQICCVLPWQLRQGTPSPTMRYACVQAESSTSQHRDKDPQVRLYSFNGLRTPFYTEKHDIYVDFVGHAINRLTTEGPLVIAGPEYIRPLITPFLAEDTAYTPLSKSDYLDVLASASKVYLNGGQNSFLEAIQSDTLPVMVLPSNQSQYGLLAELSRELDTPITEICPMLQLIPDHQRMLLCANEREALDVWSDMLAETLANKDISESIAACVTQNPAVERMMASRFSEWRDAIHANPTIDRIVLDILQGN